jgi:hypothetical protein
MINQISSGLEKIDVSIVIILFCEINVLNKVKIIKNREYLQKIRSISFSQAFPRPPG